MNESSEVKRGEFVWWTGVVEDKNDPLKLGRAKVRIFGWHAENKQEAPTEYLPWAQTMLPTNNTEVYAPKNGDMVVGFFLDGSVGLKPVMMGVMPGIPMSSGDVEQPFSDSRSEDELTTAPRLPESKDYVTDGTGIVITETGTADLYPLNLDEPTTARLARNDEDSITQTFIQERIDNVVTGVETAAGETWDEPETVYAAKYPYNNVMESESGHILEFDDTFESERIHIAHRNGSFQEWFPLGDKVEKVTKDNYQIIMGDDKIYVMGKVQITVQGSAEVYVKENVTMLVDGDVDATVHGNVTGLVDGDMDVTVHGSVTAQVDGDVTATIDGDLTATVGGNMTADIAGDSTETVGGSKTISAGGSCDITAGGSISIAGASVAITGQPISLN